MKKKKCNTAKWLSEKALQIAEKRREVKDKGEKKIYTQLNAEVQRTEGRDKKAFLSEQCKEIEENNRMGKVRDLFKKIRDTKGTLHAKMSTIKDRNGKDLIPVELFQILKDDAVKVLHSTGQQIWKTQQWPQDWKRSVFIPIPKKGNAKKCSNYCTIALTR